MTHTRWLLAVAGAGVILAFFTPLPEQVSEWWASRGQAEAAQGCATTAAPANFGFTVKDMHGHDVALSALKGKVVLMNFWATWCPPCRIEIPWFVDLQAKYGNKGFQIVGVAVDDTAEDLDPFVRRFKVNYPVLLGSDREDLQSAFGPVVALPLTVIVSRDGRMCVKHLGPVPKEQFESEIKALL